MLPASPTQVSAPCPTPVSQHQGAHGHESPRDLDRTQDERSCPHVGEELDVIVNTEQKEHEHAKSGHGEAGGGPPSHLLPAR